MRQQNASIGWAIVLLATALCGFTHADLPVVELVSQTQTAGACSGVDAGSFLIFLTDGKTLRIYNGTTPTSPQPLGSLTLGISGPIVDVAAGAGVVCLACGNDGLKVVDVSRPGQPQEIGAFDTTSFSARAVEMRNGLAYVGNGGSPAGLAVIDPTADGGPSLVGTYATGAPITDVVVRGIFALVTSSTTAKGLQIIDITHPNLPSLRGTFATNTTAESADISGSQVFIAENSGMEIVDISNPALPVLAGFYARPAEYLETVTVRNGLALVGLTYAGLEAVDISKPATPRLVGTYDPGKQPSSSTFADGLFYSTYGPTSTGGGLVILRVYVLPTAPATPTGVSAQAGVGRVLVRWDANREPDLAGYNVYRSSSLTGVYTRLNGDTLLTNTRYLDPFSASADYWYKLTAVDTDGNESTPTEPVMTRSGLIVVWVPDVKGPAGSTVRIPINVGDARGLNAQGLDILLNYDDSVLDASNLALERTAVTSRGTFFYNTAEPGVVRISGIGKMELQGEGHLFDLVGHIRNDAAADACGTVSLAEVKFYDLLARRLEVDIADTGLLCVGQKCIQGDLNNDGAVDSADALTAMNIAVGLEELQACSLESSDLNGDGRIDSADAIMIMRLAAGEPVNPPQNKDGQILGATPASSPEKQDVINVSVEQVEAAVGSIVEVPVDIDNTEGLCGLELTVTYPADRAKLTFQGIAEGALTESFSTTSSEGVGFVKVSMVAAQPLAGKQTTDNSVATLQFKVEDGAAQGESLPISVNGASLKGEYGDSLDWYSDVVLSQGSIQVAGMVQGMVVCTVRNASNQQPITNATVNLSGSGLPPVTVNLNGVYTLTPVAQGTYTLNVEAPGYQPSSRLVSVGQGQTKSELFSLTPEAEGEGEGQTEGEGQAEGEGEGQANQHALTLQVDGNGTTDPAVGAHMVDSGAQITLTATAADGWEFDHWEGALSGSDNPAQVAVNADMTITAVFKEKQKSFISCSDNAGRAAGNGRGDLLVLCVVMMLVMYRIKTYAANRP